MDIPTTPTIIHEDDKAAITNNTHTMHTCMLQALKSLGPALAHVEAVLVYTYVRHPRCSWRYFVSMATLHMLLGEGFALYDVLDMQHIADLEAWHDEVTWGSTLHGFHPLVFASRHPPSLE